MITEFYIKARKRRGGRNDTFYYQIFCNDKLVSSYFFHADTLKTLNYSGRLVHNDGSPKSGVVDLEVKFFDSEEEGTQKGSAYLLLLTTVTNGAFNLEIALSDEVITAVLDPSTATWVEITDVSNSVTYPRQKLNSVPYAIKAGLVDNSSTSATPSNTGDSIVLRDSNGNFDVSDPVSSSNVTTKSYVDTQISASHSAARAYVDSQVSSSYGGTRSYTDTEIAISNANSRSYTDTEIAISNANSRSYTDTEIAISNLNNRSYTDTEVATSNANNRSYTDTEVATSTANSRSYTDTQVSLAIPSGAIMAFYRSSCPGGWLAADGGGGRPDLRGMFLRGLNNFGTGTRSDGKQDLAGSRSLGSYQQDEMQSHKQ